jgi:hypothetical protein
MMKGKVSRIEEGSIFIRVERGQECWFDPLDESKVEIGDVVTGNLWAYGGQQIFNTTKGQTMKVFMEGHR